MRLGEVISGIRGTLCLRIPYTHEFSNNDVDVLQMKTTQSRIYVEYI